jgi:8-oxo-dGTP pyrophosphatase MutT (NUDIX family)
MHRRHLNELFDRYLADWPGERELVARFRAFVAAHDDCLVRTCRIGHITASAWIEDSAGERCLLLHHKKLGRWLQLGGHVDGEPRVEQSARREAQEESGMREFGFVHWRDELVPLDLDVHPIPARKDEPAHEHWDVRFWLRAAPGQALVRPDEANDVRWFRPDELAQVTDEESVLRLQRKAARLARHPGLAVR